MTSFDPYFGLTIRARYELEQLFWHMSDISREDFEEILGEIPTKYGGTAETARSYFDRVATIWSLQPFDRITVFVRDADRLGRKPCVDLRYGTQILPRGVWAIGFVHEGRAMFDLPYMATEEMIIDLREKIDEALLLGGDMFAEQHADQILEGEEFLAFEKYDTIKPVEAGT